MLKLAIGMISAVLACSPHGTRSSESGNPAQTLEARTHQLINAEREEAGQAPLVRHQALDALAREHSRRMARGNVRFGHRGSRDRARKAREAVASNAVAENVAQNQGYADPASIAVQGWMRSRGHRRNLLGEFNLTGLGAAVARDGTVYLTQIFTQTE